MDKGNRAVLFCHRTKYRQCHCVVSTHGNGFSTVYQHLIKKILDDIDGFQQVERIDRDIANVGYLEGVNQDGEPIRSGCTTCKNLKAERFVRYR